MKSLFTTLLFTCLLTFSLHAQQINNLIIIPSSPTTIDTVKVVALTGHSTTPCRMASSTVEVIDTTIVVNAFHAFGQLPTLCQSYDTTILGVLNPGNYELHFHLINDNYQHTWDIDTISFTVVEHVGIWQIVNPDSEIAIFPIPTGNELTIQLPPKNTGYLIKIYSHLGREITAIFTRKEVVTIDLSDLPGGMFYAIITDKYGRRWTKKIIKQR